MKPEAAIPLIVFTLIGLLLLALSELHPDTGMFTVAIVYMLSGLLLARRIYCAGKRRDEID